MGSRISEREQAAALGDGPLAMFDDGLPLKFLRGPHPRERGAWKRQLE
jgi:hypothetical protein